MRVYYRLPELAKKWKKTEDDLLHMAATGALRLSVKHFGAALDWEGNEVEIDGYVQIDNDDCESILEFGCERFSSLIRHVTWRGKRLQLYDKYEQRRDMIRAGLHYRICLGDPTAEYIHERELFDQAGIPSSIPVNRLTLRSNRDLLILPEEVERMKEKYSELRSEQPFELEGKHPEVVQHDESGDMAFLNGEAEIKEYFYPITWNTIKGWLTSRGVPKPEKGDTWRVPIKTAVEIRMEKKSFIETKTKNKK